MCGYLGSKPYLDLLSLFWSVPHATRAPSWAEDYHFDFDNLKWLKIFVNFEEIRLENGPPHHMEGTHKYRAIPSEILQKGYTRLKDAEVSKHIDRKHEKVFLVPAGSLLIEDTRGLHKRLTPTTTTGRRLMLTMQYSILLIEQPANKLIACNFPITNSFASMLKTHDNIAVKYFSAN